MSSPLPPLTSRLHRWITQKPMEALLVLLLIAVIVGFYGFFPAYGPGGYQSALSWLKSTWTSETDYGHGFLIGPLILALLWWRFSQEPSFERKHAVGGLFVFLGGILLWIIAYRVMQARVAVASLSFVAWGGTWYLFGWKAAKLSFLPFFLLLLAIPVPGLIQATNGLQVLATKFGYHGAKLFGVDCLYSGTNIQSAIAGKWGFNIAEGCSGIRSLMAMILISTVYVYIIDLPLWRRALVFLAALPLAIFVNAIRITSIILIAEYGDKEFAAGIYHNWASFFIFPIGILGMLGVHQLLTLDRRVRKRVVRRQKTSPTP